MDKYLQDFNEIINLDLEQYFYNNNLAEIIGVDGYLKQNEIGPNDTYEQEGGKVFLPDCGDLTRLHSIVRLRKCLTVLELGSGVSTRIIAHALHENKKDYSNQISKVRRQDPFTLYSVEAEKDYAEKTEETLKEYSGEVKMIVSKAVQTSYKDNICGRYEQIPSICPDLIYIDGPSPYSYTRDKKEYFNISHPDITNITCDLLLLEPFLLPGTFVVFDGMTNNSRFNRRMLNRTWKCYEDVKNDYTIMVLDEDTLGIHHKNQIKFITK